MVNKSGWLRIIEATVCIIVILGVILIIYRNNNHPADLNKFNQIPILIDELLENNSMRDRILNSTADNKLAIEDEVTKQMLKKLNKININLATRICKVDQVEMCKLQLNNINYSNVYVKSRLISTNVESSQFNVQSDPRKIVIYIWYLD